MTVTLNQTIQTQFRTIDRPFGSPRARSGAITCSC
jgi:hypothetical protein